MGKVENFNSYKKCCEETCDNDYTHFEIVKLDGVVYILELCEKHYHQRMGIKEEIIQ